MQSQRRTDTTFACPLVGRRDLERRQQMHRDKVQRMSSSIDTRAPAAQPHLTLYGRDYVAKKRATTEAAFSDLKMIQSIAKTMTRKPDLPERKGPVSLNADARKSEIFRIMKENHRLLDRLETLEPVVSTNDLLREHKYKQRYTILVSHSKRLAGEYDDEATRIRTEDKAKTDSMNRSVELRRTKYQMMQSSMSMPSLTPMAATDPSVMTGVAASPKPTPKRVVKPVVARPLGATGGSSSSNARSAPAPPPEPKSHGAGGYPGGKASPPGASPSGEAASKPGRASRVSFSAAAEQDDSAHDWQRIGGPTPHPKKIPREMFFEEDEDDEGAGGKASPPAAADPAARLAQASLTGLVPQMLEEAPPAKPSPAAGGALAGLAQASLSGLLPEKLEERQQEAATSSEPAAAPVAFDSEVARAAVVAASDSEIKQFLSTLPPEQRRRLMAAAFAPEAASRGPALEAAGAAPAAAAPAQAAAPAAESPPAAAPAAAPAAEAPGQEFDPGQAPAQVVGVTGPSATAAAGDSKDDNEEDYGDETFEDADETENNLSKAMADGQGISAEESGTFEEESATFESSKEG